ncbi:MAG TPA: ATP-binding protein [Flavilitoribacter sp.]|nr:ATP-binding protein [Flavilitoribacter sp.]
MAKRNILPPFSENLIIERLRFENPWWVTNATDEEYRGLKYRQYFHLFHPLVEETEVRRAVVLMGPRRVGKTVMLFHTIQHLIDSGVSPLNILYANIENPIYNHIPLERLFQLARRATGRETPENWFVFFDEIQYLKDWEIHLKVLVDSYPRNKFTVSGSAAAALKLKSTESGAGRLTDFLLPPLTFHEYVFLKGLDHLMQPAEMEWKGNLYRFFSTINVKELNLHFIDYINFGGYPEVIFSDRIRSNPGRYIRSDIVDKVLLRDLPSLYGIQDVQELNRLFSTLAYHSGNEVSLDALSKASQVEKYLLRKYLEYLEAAFLIRIVNRVDDNARRFKRANFFKVYLTNPSLRSALFSPLQATDEHIGNMVETAIFAQWMHREWFIPWYARWNNGEVDMVSIDDKKLKPQWALEIKWSNRFFDAPGDLKGLLQFCQRNELPSAIVTTIDKEGKETYNGITLHFVPAAVYAYVVAINTLEHKYGR